jgi:Tfp pilus assembly protein PilN
MSHINLLPWREELKKTRNQIFYIILGIAFAVSVLVVVLIDYYLNYRIAVENANVQYINKELDSSKLEVGEMQELQKNKKQFTERMNTIQVLQADRPAAIKLLDLLPRVLPEGVYLTELTRREVVSEMVPDQVVDKNRQSNLGQKKLVTEKKQYNIVLQGVALTNGSISVLLKKLEAIKWLTDIKLNEVSINKAGNGLNFNLGFKQNLEYEG